MLPAFQGREAMGKGQIWRKNNLGFENNKQSWTIRILKDYINDLSVHGAAQSSRTGGSNDTEAGQQSVCTRFPRIQSEP